MRPATLGLNFNISPSNAISLVVKIFHSLTTPINGASNIAATLSIWAIEYLARLNSVTKIKCHPPFKNVRTECQVGPSAPPCPYQSLNTKQNIWTYQINFLSSFFTIPVWALHRYSKIEKEHYRILIWSSSKLVRYDLSSHSEETLLWDLIVSNIFMILFIAINHGTQILARYMVWLGMV